MCELEADIAKANNGAQGSARQFKEEYIMVVQHNLTAMNSNRMLGLTTASQAKSTEKLSSGYKINRAADDAAGLSISEKMRKQIRGLTQASNNAQDGISTVQTAEGALNEVQDMLQRMNELAVKSANGTNSETDRSYIQNEIDQLVTEIDRVSETTKFNETYLLKGNAEGKVGSTKNSVAVVGTEKAKLTEGMKVNAGDVTLGTVGAVIDNTNNGIATEPKIADTNALKNSAVGTALNKSTDGEITITYSKTDDKWTISGTGVTNAILTTDQLKDAGLNVVVDKTQDDNKAFKISKKLIANDKLADSGVTYDAAQVGAADLKGSAFGSDVKATIKVDDAGTATIEAYDANYVPNALKLDLHVGADSTSNNKISLEIQSMSAKGIGLLDANGELRVDGKDSTNADKAIDTIANAIQRVSTQRSALGAVQNRLEHTINNLDNVVENTTSAESAIRDTDMATEMVKYSNNNILSQAGQAMLAQANQSNQGVLSLLQ